MWRIVTYIGLYCTVEILEQCMSCDCANLYLLLTSIHILYVFGILWLIFHLTRYSNMFVTSPSPENLHTLFEFVFKGFDALEYQVCLNILDQGAFFS